MSIIITPRGRVRRLARSVRLLASLPRIARELDAHGALLDLHDRQVREILDSMHTAVAAAGIKPERHLVLVWSADRAEVMPTAIEYRAHVADDAR